MNDFNTYLNNLDYSHVKDLFARKGILRTYHKKDFFIRQNEVERFAGWVKHGTFQYTHIDEEGEEHIVGYAFTDEFVCDYSSFMKSCLSAVSIQALTDCSVYENLYEMVYERLLDSYCTPEIRYQRLMKRCPDLKDTVSLKSIASFLGVTPETVSRIRRKLEK